MESAASAQPVADIRTATGPVATCPPSRPAQRRQLEWNAAGKATHEVRVCARRLSLRAAEVLVMVDSSENEHLHGRRARVLSKLHGDWGLEREGSAGVGLYCCETWNF